jgi:signal transduction histidine kinase/ActR/RegA family two-component response regulator
MLRDGLVVAPEDLPLQRAARGELVRDEELDHVFDDGTVRHTLVSAQRLHDASGAARGAIATILDVTALRDIENKLREADRHKDMFLATLSHELRNPLAPLRSALGILEGSADPSTVRTTTAIMERQLNQLIALIDDLLDVSRISRGKVRLRKTRVELATAIAQALEAIRPIAERHRQAVGASLPESAILLDADAVRLAQIFINLLDNACKYSPANGSIQLSVDVQGHEAVISVKDSGIGIPPDKLDEIFEMFSQVDRTDRGASGLGIGLSLAKHLVELHGGSIVACSDGLGCGSEFIVRMPMIQSTHLDVTATPMESAIQSGARRRILIVDDNEDGANMLASLLEMSGHEVQTAYDGRVAIEQGRMFKPDLISLDIGLPQMDGYEVCRMIRKEPWGAGIIMVALTGWGQDEDRRKSSEAGFDTHMVKPVDPRALLRLIDTCSTSSWEHPERLATASKKTE